MPMYHPEANYDPGDVPAPSSPLSDAGMTLADNIAALQAMLMSLEKRLSPLLCPNSGPENRSEDTAVVRDIATSQHVAELQKHNVRLQDVRRSLGWLLDRLDV